MPSLASWRLSVLSFVGLVALAWPVAAQAQGRSQFTVCAGCHQANGRGLPGAFPPLAGSDLVIGAPEIPIRIVILGLQGPLSVNGQRFNSTMPAWGSFSDADIAATLTYVRSQWGNAASAVTAEQVTAVRRALAGRTRTLTGPEIEAMKPGS